MARVRTVNKAQKDQGTCGACSTPLPRGCTYRWWKFRFGPKRVRCMDTKCSPARSQLTQSEYYGALYDAEDAFNKDIDAANNVEDVATALIDANQAVEEIRSELEEKYSAIEEHFPSGCPNMETIEERQGACEELASELDNLSQSVEEDFGDCSSCDGSGEEETECEACEGHGTIPDGEEKEVECEECGGDGTIYEECGQCEGDSGGDFEGARDDATAIDWDQAMV